MIHSDQKHVQDPSSRDKVRENGSKRFGNLVKEKCETPRKSNCLKKGKIVISVKIRNFSRSRMTKRTSPLESSREI